MTTTHKHRAVAGPTVSQRYGVTYSPFDGHGPWVLNPLYDIVESGVLYPTHQYVVSEGHQVSLLGGDHKHDIGGPYLNHRVDIKIGQLEDAEVSNHVISWSDTDGYLTRHCDTLLVPEAVIRDLLLRKTPTIEQIEALCPVPVSDFDLDSYGATAVSRVAPTNPLADAASTIGELRDGLPHIPNPKGNAGSEYLNVEFGIRPTIGELQDYRKSWLNAEKLLEQLERDSGKLVRRQYHFPVEYSYDEVEDTVNRQVVGLPTGQPDILNVRSGKRKLSTHIETKIWFSGGFTYYLPKEGWRRTMSELDYLYGVRPGIDTVWELTPWSWLVDYQLNVGDVLKNITAFSQDGLVMPYGYVMAQQRKVQTYLNPIQWSDYGVWRDKAIVAEVVSTTQQRRPANPFGFGFDAGGMTLRQGAILAALGISRL